MNWTVIVHDFVRHSDRIAGGVMLAAVSKFAKLFKGMKNLLV